MVARTNPPPPIPIDAVMKLPKKEIPRSVANPQPPGFEPGAFEQEWDHGVN